jgi:hypothetical protein
MTFRDDIQDPWYEHPILPHLLGFFVLLALGMALIALFN